MGSISKHHFGVILAGGGGTRLWPKSRNARPKQFLKIGSSNTLLQDTYDRLVANIPSENILIVTSRDYVEEIKKELPGFKAENILVEPSPKNTAPAIALAVWEINKRDPDSVIGSFASDHLVRNKSEFVNVLATAYQAAEVSSDLVTVGILPSKADDSLGYIHAGSEFEIENKSVFKVKRFTEKPDLTLAKAFLASGDYFWNASYFLGKASTFLESYRKFMPELSLVIDKISEKSETEADKLWSTLENIAIDYGIMEKAKNLVMVPADFGWSDVGNWVVLMEVFPKTADGNVLLGDHSAKHVLLDSKDCLVYGDGSLITTIGVSDLIIVQTQDAILICHKDQAQKVKNLVEVLKNEGKEDCL
ncbi:mannose-1-phosphate guanylyltransferase [Candidatus Gottesmanbacteria bacterium]|nr:mannose-1-phosphate guanylyltransferase [Candidatus Gottesmanbacteria bacterium]